VKVDIFPVIPTAPKNVSSTFISQATISSFHFALRNYFNILAFFSAKDIPQLNQNILKYIDI